MANSCSTYSVGDPDPLIQQGLVSLLGQISTHIWWFSISITSLFSQAGFKKCFGSEFGDGNFMQLFVIS